jgi:IS5 family transposase
VIGSLCPYKGLADQIVIEYEVYEQRPNDSDLLMPAIEVHAAKLGRVPRLVATDAGFYSAKICIPNRGSKNAARTREHKKRWIRDGQRSNIGRTIAAHPAT